MRASRCAQFPLTLALLAFVVIGGAALAAPHTELVADSSAATFARGLTRAVDATIADTADPRGGADRHAPRNHALPFLLPASLFGLVLVLFGSSARRAHAIGSLRTRIRGIGPRAPPVFAAH